MTPAHTGGALIKRSDLEGWLEALTTGERTTESLREWLKALIIGERVDVTDDDNALIMDVAHRLDAASDELEFNSIAQDTRAVLTTVPQNDAARALLPLVWGRDRLIQVLEKHQVGLVGDVHLRSFLKSDKWPIIARAIQVLDNRGREELLGSLRAKDYGTLSRLLLGRKDWQNPRRRR